MDELDAQLLELMQRDTAGGHAELARAVGLSPAGIHKRLKRLEAQGYVRRTVTLLDRERLGLDLLCFITVTFKTNTNTTNMQHLKAACAGLPEVLECYTLTGVNDAVMKVVVRDHKHLRDFLRRFASAQKVVASMHTGIVLEELKETHELPVRAPS